MDWLSVAGAIFLVWLVLVFLFTPGINYHLALPHVGPRRRLPVHASVDLPGGAASRQPGRRSSPTGRPFYPAMIEAIRGATRSINMECYIFQPGRIADQFIEALSERARSGRQRHDRRRRDRQLQPVGPAGAAAARRRGAGSSRTSACGGTRCARLNNRTHRELLVVDGTDRVRRRRRASPTGGRIPQRRQPRRGATRWRASRGRSSRRCRASPPRTGWSAAARSSPGPTTSPTSSRAATRRRSWSRARRRIARRPRASTFQLLMEGADQHVRHQHAVLPARPRAAARADRGRAARRRGHGHRAGAPHRSEVGAAGQPADVGAAARGGRRASTSTATR